MTLTTARLVRAEWTKVRSVLRWVLALLSAIVLTVLMSVLIASSSGTDANEWIWENYVAGPDGDPVEDSFRFVHQPMTGDGTLTAQVRTLEPRGGTADEPDARAWDSEGNDWAKAGIMIKERAEGGAPYAAMMVTPGHGVRMQANFATDLAGSAGAAPRWLRLTRAGSSITGFESADGANWTEVGTVDLDGMPDTVDVGLFVASPDDVRVERQFGATDVGATATLSTAEFGDVSVESAGSQPNATWSSQDIGPPATEDLGDLAAGSSSQSDGIFSVTGSGDIGPYQPEGDDPVQISLAGVIVGLIVIITVAVLFVTSEYKRGMNRLSFLASPHRGRVLAAKSVVIGGVSLVLGLIACLTAALLAVPILRSNGFGPPAIPDVSFGDPAVVRAIVGSGVLFAAAAVLSVGIATVTRRSASAITLTIGLVIVPLLVATALPASAAKWLMQLTPAGGFAIQRTQEPTDILVDPAAMVGPWNGLGALGAYTVAALAVAGWTLRRSDA